MQFAISEIKLTSDRTYLDKFYRTNYRTLFNLAALIVGEAGSSEIVSNAMLSLFSLVPKLRVMGERECVAYLRATVRNAAYKQYNAQKRRNLSELPCDSLLFSIPGPVQDNPANIAIKNEEYRMVREAMIR